MPFLQSLKRLFMPEQSAPRALPDTFDQSLRITFGYSLKPGLSQTDQEPPQRYVAQLTSAGEEIARFSDNLAPSNRDNTIEISLDDLYSNASYLTFMVKSFGDHTFDWLDRLTCTAEFRISARHIEKVGLEVSPNNTDRHSDGIAIFGQLHRSSVGWSPESLEISSCIGSVDRANAMRGEMLAKHFKP